MSDLPTVPREPQVVIVDDHQLFSHTVAIALTRQGYRVTTLDLSHDAPPTPLLKTILDGRPDVLLLDLDLAEHGDGHRLIEPADRAGIDVIVVTGSEQPDLHARALAAGARAVLTKTVSLAELVETVRLVGPPLRS